MVGRELDLGSIVADVLMCPSGGLSHQTLRGGLLLQKQDMLFLSFSGEQQVPRGESLSRGSFTPSLMGTVRHELQLLEMIDCCLYAVH